MIVRPFPGQINEHKTNLQTILLKIKNPPPKFP